MKSRDGFFYWRHQENGDGTEWWYVQNALTRTRVSCNSESACLKIIQLAVAMRSSLPLPFRHHTLERKAWGVLRQPEER